MTCIPRYFVLTDANCSSTAPACSSDLMPEMMLLILPCGPMMNVVRSIPMYFRPYMLFSLSTPNCLAIALSGSESNEKGNWFVSLNFLWAEGLSAEMPNTSAPVRWIFWYASRNPRASSVQPEVLALG